MSGTSRSGDNTGVFIALSAEVASSLSHVPVNCIALKASVSEHPEV